MELNAAQWLVVLITAFLYGFNKTGIVGCAIVTTPLLLMLFTPGQALGIVLPLLLIADVITIVLLRHSVRWIHIRRALPWALAGIVAGWLVARHAVGMTGTTGDAFLRKVIAATLVCLVLFGFYLRRRPDLTQGPAAGAGEDKGNAVAARTWFTACMGIFGGMTTMLANNGGPAWVVYLGSLRLDVREFLGTAAWLFFVQNLAKLPFAIQLGFVTSDTLHLNLYLVPALVVGVATGGYVAKRVSKRLFDNLTQGLALVGAVYLLFV